MLLYPALVIVAIITQIPFVFTVYLSFLNWNLLRPDLGRTFTGLGNYVLELSTAEFWTILLQTLAITAMALAMCCLIGSGWRCC